MRDKITDRLNHLGYEAVEADIWTLDFLIEKVEYHIKNYCNIEDVPKGLEPIAVDRVVGEFLSNMKAAGKLEGFNAEKAVKQISEGDTSVTFAIGDATSALDALISYLTASGQSDLIKYRRFAW